MAKEYPSLLLKARLKLLPEADREKVLARRKRFLAATTMPDAAGDCSAIAKASGFMQLYSWLPDVYSQIFRSERKGRD